MRLFDSLKASVRPKAEPGLPTPTPDANRSHSSPGQSHHTNIYSTKPGAEAKPEIGWRVIFVGGDPDWFGKVERETLAIQPNWSCHHALGVNEAEAALETGAFDGLVVDGHVADVGELLRRVEEKTGKMICLVRCDVSDRTTVAQWNHSGMTPVSTEAEAAVLVQNLKRLERVRGWMCDPAIKKILPQIRKLPTEPGLHAKVSEQLQAPDSAIQTIALLIAQDPIMSAKILQVVNSAFFGLSQQVTDTAEAVMVLGTERIRSLILVAGVFSQYGDAKCPGFSAEPIWSHSLQVAMFARSITFAESKDAKMAETAFTAGLLHDIGKLVLAGNVPEMYDTVKRVQASKKISQEEAELTVLGTSHAQLGASLLGTWGLPLSILEAIACHHCPSKSPEKGFSILAAVHAANVFAQECGQASDDFQDTISLEYLLKMGLGDCRNVWRECCGIAQKQEAGPPEDQVLRRREAKQN